MKISLYFLWPLFFLINIDAFLLEENLPDNLETYVFEETINKSVECVRGVLNDGIPELGLPSFNPLVLDEINLNLDDLNLEGFSGQISIKNGIATGIVSFVMTEIVGQFILVPPTFIVDFGLHYDEVYAAGDYKLNITVNGTNIWGEGSILSGVENLNAVGYVRALVDINGVEIQEFNAPITLETYNFQLTGLFDDEELSAEISERVSNFVPDYVNNHPEIFTEVIAPIFIDIFNALVNDDAGLKIIKEINQICILDILFPPNATLIFNTVL